MRIAYLLSFVLASLGCASTGTGERSIDRTGFDLAACAPASARLFEALTPATPVDYLEWRSHVGGEAARGTRCAGASDATACEDAVASLTAPVDAWAAMTSGGAPAPLTYLVFTRGDEVGAVGRDGLGALLAPLDAADAAFVAQAATQGTVPCCESRVRAVPGGHEVIVSRTHTCGCQRDELLVMVGADGAAEILELVVVAEGEAMICP